MEERVSIESIEKRFYNDFTEHFLCSLPNILSKFLIDRGVAHIVEPHPSLIELPSNTNWAKKKKAWENFTAEREWEYFLTNIQNHPSLLKHRVGYGGVAGHVSG